MKFTICLIFLFMLGNLAWGAPKGSTTSVPPNIIPITTLNDNVHNDQGIPQHEPCAATRLTPTLLFTAAHCLVDLGSNGSRIHAEPFEAEDGTQGLIFSNARRQHVAQPNAQFFLYRPNYTQKESIRAPFDFAVVVLDSKLTFNSNFVRKTLEQAPLDSLPQAAINNMEAHLLREVQGEFAKQSAAYTKFIKNRLDAVSLLTMTPKGVTDELRGRSLSAYFWNGHEYNSTRDSVQILSQTGAGTGELKDSHLLLFRGKEFHPGTSGSPVFDTQRKAVVSVANGTIFDGSNNLNGGGLIDQAVCAWVKQHDRAVKCLVRHDGVVANEQETPGQTIANVQATPNPVAKKQKTPKGSSKH